jgi:hypothetical protein
MSSPREVGDRDQKPVLQRGEQKVVAVVGGGGVQRLTEALLVGPAAIPDHRQLVAIARVVGIHEVRQVEQVQDAQCVDVAGMGTVEHLGTEIVVGGIGRRTARPTVQHGEARLQEQLLERDDRAEGIRAGRLRVLDLLQLEDSRRPVLPVPTPAPTV